MTALSVADLLHDRRYEAAIARMQDLCRIADPEVPVDAAEIQAEFEARRRHLRSVVEPEPFRVTYWRHNERLRAEQTEKTLESLGFDTTHVHEMDGFQ